MTTKEDNLIIRFLSNELNKEEKEHVRHLLNSSESFKEQFDSYKIVWDNVNGIEAAHYSKEKDNAWSEIEKHIQGKEITVKKQGANKQLWFAAAALILISISYVVLTFQKTQNLLLTDNDQQKEIELIDGTAIKVNENSELRYFTEMNDSIRYVELIGEAYFAVAKHKKPFIVKMKGTVLRVLGTEFNIKTSNEKTIVTVSEGLVSFQKLNKPGKKVLIRRGERSEYKPGKKIKTVKIEKQHFQWYSESTFFDNEPLNYVLSVLELNFDVEIIRDSIEIKYHKVTARFSREQNIESILKAIEQMYQIKIHKINERKFMVGKTKSI